jgi:hypothetical protein
MRAEREHTPLVGQERQRCAQGLHGEAAGWEAVTGAGLVCSLYVGAFVYVSEVSAFAV